MPLDAGRQDAPAPSSLTHTPSLWVPAKSLPDSRSSELTCLPASALLVTDHGAPAIGRSSRATPAMVATKMRRAGLSFRVSCCPFGDSSVASVMCLTPFCLRRQRHLRLPARGLAAIVRRDQLYVDSGRGQPRDRRRDRDDIAGIGAAGHLERAQLGDASVETDPPSQHHLEHHLIAARVEDDIAEAAPT